ncbi:MAG: hypothetical protein WKF96_01800 [Solirubrobacteraceae bacterium]
MTLRARHFAIAAAVLVVLVFVIVLARSAPRLAATNTRVIASANEVFLAPGENRCQGGEYVPEDAARLRVYPGGAGGGPALVVALRDEQMRRLAVTPVPAGYDGGVPLDVPLPPRGSTVDFGFLCIRNAGTAPIGFAGNLRTANPAAPGGVNGFGQRGSDEVRADYFLPGSRSGFSIAPRVIERAALLRPGFMGPWTVWGVLALLVATCAAGITWFVRRLDARP